MGIAYMELGVFTPARAVIAGISMTIAAGFSLPYSCCGAMGVQCLRKDRGARYPQAKVVGKYLFPAERLLSPKAVIPGS
jgi:hypothetical protein